MTTVYDVAAHAGVSIATVSRALNERARISAATRRRVLDAASELGYVPNDVARSLVAKSTQTVALFLSDIANPFFPEVVKGVQTAADERGHLLLLCHTGDDETKALNDIQRVRRKQVDGIIIVAGKLPGTRIASVVQGLPVVVLDRALGLPAGALVTADHRAGARSAVEHLIALGHRVIAHVTGPPGLSVADRRREGWADAMQAAKLKPSSALLFEGDFTEAGGYEAGVRMLSAPKPVTAVFAANDLTAIGVMAALNAHGRRVPHDVSVVGYDGIHLSAYTNPPLTTVAQPIYELGRRAALLLFERLEAKRRNRSAGAVVLGTELVIRASTAPYRAEAKGRRHG